MTDLEFDKILEEALRPDNVGPSAETLAVIHQTAVRVVNRKKMMNSIRAVVLSVAAVLVLTVGFFATFPKEAAHKVQPNAVLNGICLCSDAEDSDEILSTENADVANRLLAYQGFNEPLITF